MFEKDIQNLIDPALEIYRYGSVVYGTAVPGVSDEDFVVVLKDSCIADEMQCEVDNKQYTFYPESRWRKMIEDNDVCAMECLMLPDEFIIKGRKYDLQNIIDPEKIRRQFSATASNSWVKCKKKLTVEKDFAPRVGKKSLWHSLRLLMFGIQILKYGKIYDYGCANGLYDKIVNNPSNDWQYYKDNYQSLYNTLKSEFRSFDRIGQGIDRNGDTPEHDAL